MSFPLTKRIFKPQDLRVIGKCSYRELSYAAKTGFCEPTGRRNRLRYWDFKDLLVFWVHRTLHLEHGISINRLRTLEAPFRAALDKVKWPLTDPFRIVIWKHRYNAPMTSVQVHSWSIGFIQGVVVGDLPAAYVLETWRFLEAVEQLLAGGDKEIPDPPADDDEHRCSSQEAA